MAKTAKLPVESVAEDELAQWSGHPLAQYLAAAWRNTVRSFSAEGDRYRTLSEVDAVFRTLVGDTAVNAERVAMGFLTRAHGEWLSAVSLCLSGQVSQAYSLLGTALETAMHGLYVSSSPERQKLWVGRNDDAAAMQRADVGLDMEAALADLRERDAATAEIFGKLMARSKERAAHANTYADLSRQPADSSGGADCRSEYFVCENDVQRSCLRSTAQAGICVLTIFFYVFGEQYRELELGERINKLRQGH